MGRAASKNTKKAAHKPKNEDTPKEQEEGVEKRDTAVNSPPLRKGRKNAKAESKRTAKAPKKAGKRTRSTKALFKHLRGASPHGPPCELYSQFTKADEPNMADGYYQGAKLDLRSRFENDALVYTPTAAYINAVDSDGACTFIGLKESMAPLNIFDFQSGPGLLAVYDGSLSLVNWVDFQRGPIIQLSIVRSGADYKCLAVFHNGEFASFDYSCTANGATDPPVFAGTASDRDSCLSGRGVSNYRVLEADRKIIRFRTLDDVLIYTDGFVVTVCRGEQKTESMRFKYLIVDLVLAKQGDRHIIVLLDRNGRHLSCELDFSAMKDVAHQIGACQLLYFPRGNYLYSSDGSSMRVLTTENDLPKMERLRVRYYYHTADGTVEARRIHNKPVSQRLLKIVERREGLLFCTAAAEMDQFAADRHPIIYARDFDGCVIVGSERGFLAKFSLE
ncbi:hypothetical protein PAPHI01_1267 [Pancytospora philotis]|nr:hypothetical protein PAPHI01_1267 [Pancytospora philotis]